jgi:hypothetical protein
MRTVSVSNLAAAIADANDHELEVEELEYRLREELELDQLYGARW